MGIRKYPIAGEIIKLEKARRVCRVGYPLTPRMVRDQEPELLREGILAAMDAMGLKMPASPSLFSLEPPQVPVEGGRFGMVCWNLAQLVVEDRGYGGNERSLHFEDWGEVGWEMEVLARKQAFTGIRYPPSYWDSSEGGLHPRTLNILLKVKPPIAKDCDPFPHKTWDEMEVATTPVWVWSKDCSWR